MKFLAVAFLGIGLIGAPLPVSANDTWTRLGGGWSHYTNERFGTAVDVPLHLFKLVEPPSENGDGRLFRSKDGAELRVYGSFGPVEGVVNETFEDYKKWLLNLEREDGLQVVYKAEGKNWLAFSGTKGPMIIYQKLVVGCDAGHTMSIEYPAARKTFYDPVVSRMARSLHCREGAVDQPPKF